MKNEFERIIRINPPFDKRHTDPKKNYGIGGMTITFLLKGDLGATQFVFYTGQHLKHVADEFYNSPNRSYNPFHGIAADIGYHSKVPMYEGHTPMPSHCDLTGGLCYYDGSSLQASEFEDEFLRDGENAVWRMLEDRYNYWLKEHP